MHPLSAVLAAILCVFTPDGQETTKDLYLLSPDGRERSRLTRMPGSEDHPQWSPDGQWIAFDNRHDGQVDVYLMRRDGSERRNLSQHAAWDTGPTWSPDGQNVAFASARAQGWRLVVASREGRSQHILPCPFPGGCSNPQWSPDGKRIAFVTSQSQAGSEVTAYRLAVIRPNGTDARQLATLERGGDGTFSWSPDGGQLVYAGSDRQLHLIQADTGRDHPLTQGDFPKESPCWSPDGTLIAFSQDGTIGTVNPKNGDVRLYREVLGLAPQWAPDSQSLVIMRPGAGIGLSVLNLATGHATSITSGTGLYLQPAWSPR